MDTQEINSRLLAVADVIKAKGWTGAIIEMGVQYLAIFDREPSLLDPMISWRPSIRASTRDRYGIPTPHEFVKDWFDIKTIDDALKALEVAANAMPRMNEEAARIESAKAKLSDDERNLLGIR